MVHQVVFRSEDVPAGECYESWQDVLTRSVAPMELFSEFRDTFWCRHRAGALGSVSHWSAASTPWGFRRTRRHVRLNDGDFLHIGLQLTGRLHVERARAAEGRGVVDAGDLTVEDSSQPLAARADAHAGPCRSTSLIVPKSLLPLPRRQLDRASGLHLSGRDGYGALLAQLLRQLGGEQVPYAGSEALRLGTLAVHLTAAALAQATDGDRSLAPETRQEALLARVKEFIRHHLHDPGLTPATIAAAHHISLRYLYRIFRTEDTTVAAWIRRKRLLGARDDLADPALHALRVHEIAARWCFSSASDFTRAFRSAFGVSPSEYRHLHSTAPQTVASRSSA